MNQACPGDQLKNGSPPGLTRTDAKPTQQTRRMNLSSIIKHARKGGKLSGTENKQWQDVDRNPVPGGSPSHVASKPSHGPTFRPSRNRLWHTCSLHQRLMLDQYDNDPSRLSLLRWYFCLCWSSSRPCCTDSRHVVFQRFSLKASSSMAVNCNIVVKATGMTGQSERLEHTAQYVVFCLSWPRIEVLIHECGVHESACQYGGHAVGSQDQYTKAHSFRHTLRPQQEPLCRPRVPRYLEWPRP